MSLTKRQTIVHVGFPRTGTTTLQRLVFPNMQGLRYGDSKSSADVQTALRHIAGSDPINLDVDYDEQQLREWLDDYDFLSYERLAGAPEINFKDHTSIKVLLEKLFGCPKILLTIRRQDKHLSSFYFQYLGRGGRKRFGDWLEMNAEYPLSRSVYTNKPEPGGLKFRVNYGLYDYYRFYESYCTSFGRENVLVLPLELALDGFGEYKKRLEEFTGAKVNENKFPGSPSKRSRLGSRAVTAIRLSNAFARNESNPIGFLSGKKGVISRKTLHKKLGTLGGDEVLTKTLSNAILERHRSSNKMLSDSIGVDLGRYGYF